MRHSRRNGLIAAVVAGGGLAVAGVSGLAHADADASGRAERSPGLLSGNLVQLPVHVPVNACGNTVSVIGVLNSAAGNRCVNEAPGVAAGIPERSPRVRRQQEPETVEAPWRTDTERIPPGCCPATGCSFRSNFR
ncbi:chaplin [Streptomyces sp. MS1.HAVA.3]|uniref:Chaplin n=1 Tax=Streptomyces caledonius TaxID=3134107 RepID=A0ABU8UA95_9ACTN